DITGWKPTGKLPWHEEMPPGGLEHWASRATRRTQRENTTSIRVAFVNTKFRVDADEPAPFAVEISSAAEPWTVRDITDEMVAAGDTAKEQALATRQAEFQKATTALKEEILRRAGTPEERDGRTGIVGDEPMILRKQAE